MAGPLSGLSALSAISFCNAEGLIPPPDSASLLAYYEAGVFDDVLNSGATKAADREKVATWLDRTENNHDLVQSTSANQARHRHGGIPAVVAVHEDINTNTEMANTTLPINKRAASFFALIELEQIQVQGTSVNHNIMAIAGGVGELRNRIASGDLNSGVLQWIDANGTTTTTFRHYNGLSLVGVILDAGEIRIVLNDQMQTIATPLAAGTATGFSFFKGGALGGSAAASGYAAAVWYDHALDSTELEAVRDWGESRGCIFSPTKELIGTGASLTMGHQAEVLQNVFRQYVHLNKGQIAYRNVAFAGNTTTNQLNKVRGNLSSNQSYPGQYLHRETGRQVAMILGVTNDIYTGVALSTIVANTTEIRLSLRAYGYEVICFGVAPVGTFDATMEQKRLDYNAAMAALPQRVYGPYLPYPAELVNPSDTTYYKADLTHMTKAAFDLYLRDCKSYLDSYFAITKSDLKMWMKFDGDYQDSSMYTLDWYAIGSPVFESGLWGRQCIRTVTGDNFPRGYTYWREFDYLDFSAMFWFKSTNTGIVHLVSRYTGAAGGWYFTKWSDGGIRVTVSGMPELRSSGFNGHDGNWHCLALSVDANGGRLYVSTDENPANLTLHDSDTWTAGQLRQTSNKFWRVGYDGTNDSNGTSYSDTWFQDVMFWRGSRTLAQFQAIDVSGEDIVLAPPSAPRSLLDNGPAGLDENIAWTAPLSPGDSAIEGYYVYINEDGAGWVLRATITNPAAITTDLTGLTPATAYQCRITAFNYWGESEVSNTISFTSADAAPHVYEFTVSEEWVALHSGIGVVECWGMGGQGGAGAAVTGGHGGGGGAYARSEITFVEGLTYSITVPTDPATENTVLENAAESVLVSAAFGNNGSDGVPAGAGGVGGQAGDSVGDIVFSGGTGDTAVDENGAAGGAGATDAGNGADGGGAVGSADQGDLGFAGLNWGEGAGGGFGDPGFTAGGAAGPARVLITFPGDL